MSELLDAVSELTGAVEQKVQGMAREARAVTSEIETIKGMLARGSVAESAAERVYRKAFGEWLATGDAAKLQELKDVGTGTAGLGGYGLPATVAEATFSYARTLCPWLDLCGLDVVAGRDYREPVNISDGAAAAVAETGTRSGTTEGTWREVKPSWGDYFATVQASNWARQDFPNFEAFYAREVGRQIAAKLATDIISGNGTGAVLGYANTTPVLTNDDGDNVSPNALRAATAVQYVGTIGSPVTSITLADIESLLGQFREEYLQDESFAFVMRNATYRALLTSASVAGSAFTMPREPTLFGFPVKFSAAMPAVAAGAYPIVAGAWRAGYRLVTTGGPQTIVDQVTAFGFTAWIVSQRIGGCLRSNDAVKLLKCE